MRAHAGQRVIHDLTENDLASLLAGLSTLAAEVGASIDAMFEPEQRREHRDWTWASEIHHPCARHLVHSRLDADRARPADLDAMYRFKEGRDKEWEVKKLFGDAGFEITASQTAFKISREQISGRIDGMVEASGRFPGDWALTHEVPVEIKTVNPIFFDGLDDAESILHHKKPWISKMVSQLNIYEWAFGIPAGLLAIKTFGRRPKIIPVVFNRDLLEADLAKNRLVNKHVAAETRPEPIPWEADVCELCPWYGEACQPLRTTKLDREISANDEALLNVFVELQDQARKYEQMKKEILGDGKRPGPWRGVNAICGTVEVKSDTYSSTRYEVPDDVKAPYKKSTEITRTTIERIDRNRRG